MSMRVLAVLLPVAILAAGLVWLTSLRATDSPPDRVSCDTQPGRGPTLQGSAHPAAHAAGAGGASERSLDDLLADLRGVDTARALEAATELASRSHLPERRDLLQALLAFGSAVPGDLSRRIHAALAISRFGPWCVDALADVAAAGSVTARTRFALDNLAKAEPDGLARLGDLVRTWDPAAREDRSRLFHVTVLLGAAPPGDLHAIEALGRLVDSSHPDVACAALDAIALHGSDAAREFGRVQGALERATVGSPLHVRAATAIWRLTGDAEPVLALLEQGSGDLLRSMSHKARGLTYRVLVEMGAPAVTPLEQLVRRRVPGAMAALGRMEPLPADAFRSLLTSEDEADLLLGLSGIRLVGPRGAALEAEILVALDSPASQVRVRALGALQAVSGGKEASAGRVARSLANADVQVRIAAARAFAASPAWTRAACEEVRAALTDRAVHVREYAGLALRRIGEEEPPR